MKEKQNIFNSPKNPNLKNNSWDFLRNIDIFGKIFDFRIDRQEKFQSSVVVFG